jgi:hypothetical protein
MDWKPVISVEKDPFKSTLRENPKGLIHLFKQNFRVEEAG